MNRDPVLQELGLVYRLGKKIKYYDTLVNIVNKEQKTLREPGRSI